MSSHKLRSAHVPAGGAATSQPKRGGRKQVSATVKPTTKDTEATTNVSSSNEDGEGSTDTKQVVKGKGTGKAKKGKKTRYAAQSTYERLPTKPAFL